MADWIPEGWPRVAPRLFAHEPQTLVDFLRQAFDATDEGGGGQPFEVRIGDSVMLISGDDVRPPSPGFFYLYVEDAAATYARAVELGAESLEAPIDTPWGDSRAMVKDPAGNTWQLATRIR